MNQTLFNSYLYLQEGKSEEKEVDLDELLDLDDDSKRRQFLRTHLSDCSYPQEKVNVSIMLQKLKQTPHIPFSVRKKIEMNH